MRWVTPPIFICAPDPVAPVTVLVTIPTTSPTWYPKPAEPDTTEAPVIAPLVWVIFNFSPVPLPVIAKVSTLVSLT